MIYLQRHTRPDIAPNTCYGISDIALSNEYPQHLAEVRSRLNNIQITSLYSSPLTRCSTLARDICDEIGCRDIIYDNRLKELNFGEWELMNWDDINATEDGQRWFADYLHRPTPNGEAFAELVERAKSFISEMGDSDVMAVTHSGFIRAALIASSKTSLSCAFDMEIPYGALIKL
ncbi:MAG: histidine phosphatase family protein [Rikenellaceae bacterium]